MAKSPVKEVSGLTPKEKRYSPTCVPESFIYLEFTVFLGKYESRNVHHLFFFSFSLEENRVLHSGFDVPCSPFSSRLIQITFLNITDRPPVHTPTEEAPWSGSAPPESV